MSEDSNIRTLAETATQHFRDQSYAKAIETLNKLRKLKDGSDPRILHNLGVAEYYLGKCSDGQKLLDDLAKTKEIMDNAQNQSEGDPETSAVTHELDVSLLQYNNAVVYLRAKQYNTSLAILEELYNNIEPIEDYLALRICFLLLDIYLLLKHTDKGFGVVNYLEKLLANAVRNDERATAHSQPEEDTENNNNNSPTRSKSAAEENSPLRPPFKLTTNALKFLLHTYKAKLYLLNKPNLKAAKQEIKHAMVAGIKVHPQTVPICMFLKAHLEYARQNHKKALKLMNASGQKTSPIAALPVSPENGLFGMNGSIEAFLSPQYFNNLGCISYKLKKFNAASFYFGKALKENASSSSEDSASSSAESSNAQGKKPQTKITPPPPVRDYQLDILYNMGVQLLLTGKPELAFQAFQEAALVYYRLPSVWLRLAECCVAVHVLKLREEAKARQKSSLIWKVSPVANTKAATPESTSFSSRIILPVGGELHKGLPIEDPDAPAAAEESEEPSSSSNIRMGSMSLEYAAKCLRNCLFLFPRSRSPRPESESNSMNNHSDEKDNHEEEENEEETNPISASSDLLQAALVNLAFVSLAMNNPVVALKSAEDLLEVKTGVIDIFKYLAHIYAAEALLILNKPTEAIQHLNPAMLDEIFPPPPNSNTAAPAAPSSAYTLVGVHPSPYSSLTSSQPVPNVARSMMCTNLAAAHILRDDIAQAQVCVSQALAYQPSSSRALLMQVYVDIRKGNTEAALDILKRGRPAPKRKTRR